MILEIISAGPCRFFFPVLSSYIFFCDSSAVNVVIEVPTPSDASNPKIRTSMGSAKYAPEKDALLWKIKSFPGNKVGLGKLDVLQSYL